MIIYYILAHSRSWDMVLHFALFISHYYSGVGAKKEHETLNHSFLWLYSLPPNGCPIIDLNSSPPGAVFNALLLQIRLQLAALDMYHFAHRQDTYRISSRR